MRLLDKNEMAEWAANELSNGNDSEEIIYLIVQGTWLQKLREELFKSNETKNVQNNKLKKDGEL